MLDFEFLSCVVTLIIIGNTFLLLLYKKPRGWREGASVLESGKLHAGFRLFGHVGHVEPLCK